MLLENVPEFSFWLGAAALSTMTASGGLPLLLVAGFVLSGDWR